jgi:hypothetical protein
LDLVQSAAVTRAALKAMIVANEFLESCELMQAVSRA